MISIGTKFYKWNDDTLYEIKILKIQMIRRSKLKKHQEIIKNSL